MQRIIVHSLVMWWCTVDIVKLTMGKQIPAFWALWQESTFGTTAVNSIVTIAIKAIIDDSCWWQHRHHRHQSHHRRQLSSSPSKPSSSSLSVTASNLQKQLSYSHSHSKKECRHKLVVYKYMRPDPLLKVALRWGERQSYLVNWSCKLDFIWITNALKSNQFISSLNC